jgi:hypothetical protein
VELCNRDLDGIQERLDTKQQNEFWTNLHGFALAQTRGAGPDARLIADDRLNTAVREGLQMADEKIAAHLAGASKPDRAHFWQMLHEAAEREAQATGQPKARHGGGGQSA